MTVIHFLNKYFTYTHGAPYKWKYSRAVVSISNIRLKMFINLTVVRRRTTLNCRTSFEFDIRMNSLSDSFPTLTNSGKKGEYIILLTINTCCKRNLKKEILFILFYFSSSLGLDRIEELIKGELYLSLFQNYFGAMHDSAISLFSLPSHFFIRWVL